MGVRRPGDEGNEEVYSDWEEETDPIGKETVAATQVTSKLAPKLHVEECGLSVLTQATTQQPSKAQTNVITPMVKAWENEGPLYKYKAGQFQFNGKPFGILTQDPDPSAGTRNGLVHNTTSQTPVKVKCKLNVKALPVKSRSTVTQAFLDAMGDCEVAFEDKKTGKPLPEEQQIKMAKEYMELAGIQAGKLHFPSFSEDAKKELETFKQKVLDKANDELSRSGEATFTPTQR